MISDCYAAHRGQVHAELVKSSRMPRPSTHVIVSTLASTGPSSPQRSGYEATAALQAIPQLRMEVFSLMSRVRHLCTLSASSMFVKGVFLHVRRSADSWHRQMQNQRQARGAWSSCY